MKPKEPSMSDNTLDPTLIQASNISEGDIVFVVAKDASQADIAQLQAELDEHFKPKGVLALASALEVDMTSAKAPDFGELLWVGIDGANQEEIDEAETVLYEQLRLDRENQGGAVFVSNFSPEVVTLDEGQLRATQAIFGDLLGMAEERRATIKMVFPQSTGPHGTRRTDPEWYAQSDLDNALFENTEAFMRTELAKAGYVSPGNIRDLIAEFIMSCENPPVESGSTVQVPTTIYVEDKDGHPTLLGTADTWSRSESRDIDRRMASDGSGRIEAIEPVPGSHQETMTLVGFIPNQVSP
jgi:hypothetical protein